MSAVCPYCRCPLEESDAKVACPGCDTPHHADCFEENGGCTVFGCTHAPSDEPAVHVSAGELESSEARVSETQAVVPDVAPPTPAPPPMLSANTLPPPPLAGSVLRSSGSAPPLSLAEIYAGVNVRKSRTTFVLLGVFLGALGVHNFYAGYHRKGAAQLCLTVFTCFFASIVSAIWAIVEVCSVTRDGDGQEFQ